MAAGSTDNRGVSAIAVPGTDIAPARIGANS